MGSEFASVGKKLLVKALGRQSNYIEELSTEIDIEASGCKECEVFFSNAGNTDNAGRCQNCEHKCYLVQKKYINEKNQFRVDDRLRLKMNAIKILIYLHFQKPDSNGIIKNVDIKKLADILGVNQRTITNNLQILCDYGYISYFKSDVATYYIMIDKYKETFEKGKTNGYIVVNQEWLSHILAAEDINGLRIAIRETMNIDNLNTRGGSFFNTVESSYRAIKRYLPDYCHRWKIKQIIENNRHALAGIFEFDMNSNKVSFTIKNECAAKRSRDKLLIDYQVKLREFIKEFNDNTMYAVNDMITDDKFKYMTTYNEVVQPIEFTADEIENLAHLVIYYSYEQVEEALIVIHQNYIMKEQEITNLGGLVRTIIECRDAYVA